jgi:hypothetical protein
MIYTHLMTITGWSWEYIDDYMTLPRLFEMMDYWAEHPPLHIVLAAFAGIKPSKKKQAPVSNQDPDMIIGDFAGAGFSVKTIKKGDRP